jgi:RNA polymerase sigma-70 factor (ECF subfamily)
MADVPDDRTLLCRAADGDETAVREIIRRHEPSVARTVTSMLGPGDDADDVGQEVFIRLFRAQTEFRGDAQLRTYLVRIAVNLCYDALERRRRTAGWMRLDDTDGGLPLEGPDPAEALDLAERKEILRRAVQSLEAKHQQVVVLRILEERSTRETADLLGVPEGTVMSRLTRALAKLRLTLALEL